MVRGIALVLIANKQKTFAHLENLLNSFKTIFIPGAKGEMGDSGEPGSQGHAGM